MANYYTQFSCLIDVGTAEGAAVAIAVRAELAEQIDEEEDRDLGFDIELAKRHDRPGAVWLNSGGENGEPEDVIQFVLKCAERLNLSGLWGFAWSLSCSKLRPDEFGGGAQVIDLGKRKTIDWIDCQTWLGMKIADTATAEVPDLPEDKPTLRSFMDVSSGHLSPTTWTWLDAMFAEDALRKPGFDVVGQIAGGRTRHGWLVYAPEQPVEDLPTDLAGVLAEARRRDVEYVLFDCDLPLTPGLPAMHPDWKSAA